MAATLPTRSRTQTEVFQFKPFSRKQKKVLTWWLPNSPYHEYDGIIADGAIRSGKTVSMETSFLLWAMNTFSDQNFALCGKTIGSLRRNVLKDFKKIAISRGYNVDEKRSEKLITISKGPVTNYFYYFGGRDEASQDLIQGITLAGVLFDEVALMPESFVNQATGRCSVEGSKYWFNCNPEGRLHWFKVNWINNYLEKRLLYLHFTMEDNLSLSDVIKERYRRMYVGVFYNRFILGRWCAAEGIIYDCWNEKRNSFDANVNRPWENDLYTHYVAVDYGTTNPTVFLDAYDDGDTFWVTREYYHDPSVEQKQKTTSEHADDLDAFLGNERDAVIIVDPAAEDFKLELRNRGYRVKNANNDVLEGIRTTAAMMQMGALKVDNSLRKFRAELETYVWDQKAKERGEEKPVKQKDHAMDAMRYLVKTLTNRSRMDRVARNREEAA
jgi:PBSX family phage terminase large subunit